MEQAISEEDYICLNINPNFNQIDKTRYFIPYINDLIIELDVFHGIFEGIIFAEIEFESELQSNIVFPPWFGKDISTLITNSDMSTMNSNEIFKILNKIR